MPDGQPFESEDQIRVECERWMRGLRFPVDDAQEELVGRAAVQDFDRWWSVIRELAAAAETDEQIENLGWLLGAALAERKDLSAQVAPEALEDRRLTCLLAQAIDLAWLGSSETLYEGERHTFRLFGLDRVVGAYLEYQRTGSDLDFWAYSVIGALIAEDHAEAWNVLLALVAEAHDDGVLGVVGAGFLEDFVSSHAGTYIDKIEATAAVNPRFRQALACTWIWNAVPEPVFERLARAAGSDLDRPRSAEEAASRRRDDARITELVGRVDRLADPDSPGDGEEVREAFRELKEFLDVEPPDG